jgi:two-component system nitrate/nitrite response regulator NarL
MENNSTNQSEANSAWRILIASSDHGIVERFSAALQQNYIMIKWTGRNAAKDMFHDAEPDLVLIDPKYFPDPITAHIAEMAEASQSLRIMVIENQSDRQVDQYALFKAGAHGFCKENISEALLNRAVQMVCEGEYWIQRKLIANIIDDLARELTQSHGSSVAGDNPVLDALTPRELEVAKMVRLGGNNKMIARELDISERTVKAHLSAIFRKLDIQNRLHLALYFTENN